MTPRLAPSLGAVPPGRVSPSSGDETDPVSRADALWDLVDEWGVESFPASDPPSNW